MPQLLQVGQIVEVALVSYALPDHVGAVRPQKVGTIDTEEDEARINKVFHKSDAQLVGTHHGEVKILILFS